MNPIVPAALLAAVLVSGRVEAEEPPTCDRLLSVELTPDVPDPRDPGFLSSLLSNQVGYQLIFHGQTDDSILLELTGPGPGYRCGDVLQTMRKDGRVLSIQVAGSVDSQEPEDVPVINAPLPAEDTGDSYVAQTGIGSVYWAFRHPAQAWRVVTPIAPDDGYPVSEDIRTKCAGFATARGGQAACP